LNYEIVPLDEFSGFKATIYSILPKGTELTLFDNFVEEFSIEFKDEILSIAYLLEDMGHKYGVRENFVKLNEGKPGDGIVAIYDNPDKNLRIYGIRFGLGIIILGTGGQKKTKTWQQDEKLENAMTTLMKISNSINERIQNKEIIFSADGTYLQGNLNFYNNENE
jgi:hypothetical protein